jgi:hypothetical protein
MGRSSRRNVSLDPPAFYVISYRGQSNGSFAFIGSWGEAGMSQHSTYQDAD